MIVITGHGMKSEGFVFVSQDNCKINALADLKAANPWCKIVWLRDYDDCEYGELTCIAMVEKEWEPEDGLKWATTLLIDQVDGCGYADVVQW